MNLAETRNVMFEVGHRPPFGGPVHPDQVRLFVTDGRYNMALCDRSGAIIRTFVPETSYVDDIMAALDPSGRFYVVKDLMGYEPNPADEPFRRARSEA